MPIPTVGIHGLGSPSDGLQWDMAHKDYALSFAMEAMKESAS